jgi:hypothetical protein
MVVQPASGSGMENAVAKSCIHKKLHATEQIVLQNATLT